MRRPAGLIAGSGGRRDRSGRSGRLTRTGRCADCPAPGPSLAPVTKRTPKHGKEALYEKRLFIGPGGHRGEEPGVGRGRRPNAEVSSLCSSGIEG